MKLLALAAIATSMSLVAALGITLSHDHLRNACYDAGRKVGGMEQRVFDAAANGDQVLQTDKDALAKGAPDECR